MVLNLKIWMISKEDSSYLKMKIRGWNKERNNNKIQRHRILREAIPEKGIVHLLRLEVILRDGMDADMDVEEAMDAEMVDTDKEEEGGEDTNGEEEMVDADIDREEVDTDRRVWEEGTEIDTAMAMEEEVDTDRGRVRVMDFIQMITAMIHPIVSGHLILRWHLPQPRTDTEVGKTGEISNTSKGLVINKIASQEEQNPTASLNNLAIRRTVLKKYALNLAQQMIPSMLIFRVVWNT